MKNSKKGFTLIELIVVLAILAVIAAIAVPTAFGAITDAQVAADTASIEGYNSAIRMQGTLLRANATVDAAKNKVSVAITNADISAATTPQSTIMVKWNVPTATSIGSFSVVTTGGTALVETTPLQTQLLAIVTAADATQAIIQ